jgi:hypothetical protein
LLGNVGYAMEGPDVGPYQAGARSRMRSPEAFGRSTASRPSRSRQMKNQPFALQHDGDEVNP